MTTQDEQWTTGDLTLVSADNVIFKVNKDIVSMGRYVLSKLTQQLMRAPAPSSAT